MKVADFKDKHEGERCFVLGCGPSLANTNLDLIVGEISFAMNNIALIYPQTKWRPTYYWNSTKSVNRLPSWMRHANAATTEATTSFIRKESGIDDGLSVIRVNYKAVTKGIGPGKSMPHAAWSTNPSEVVFHYRMSAYGLMQLVTYMGCNPVYMLGFDTRYTLGNNHFTPDYEGEFVWTEELVVHEEFYQTRAHSKIKLYCDHLGIEVYDCTVGGALRVYPKMRLEDALGQ